MSGQAPARGRHGFTLLELSLVLTIIAVIIGFGAQFGLDMRYNVNRASTQNKLDTIEKALMSYRTAYNRLPCPADATLATTSAYYGVESVNAGACTTGSTYNASGVRTAAASPGPTANYIDTTNKVVEGALPFKALGLPESFMYDGWGRKISYAVNL